jgi:hypothetical protein
VWSEMTPFITPGILDFKQVWSFFFKPRRISVSSHKAHNDHKRISGRSFKLVIAFHCTFDAKIAVRDFQDFGGELYA